MNQTALVATDPLMSPRHFATLQYLTFLLRGQLFAVGILNVKEIIEYGQITEVPMVPPFIRGVINLRGSVVPVIDLAARFGGAPANLGRRACIVIIEARGGELQHDIGVVVDAVSEVLEIPGTDIEPPPSFGTGIRTDFVAGMGKVGGRFVIILDIQRVLSIDDVSRWMDATRATPVPEEIWSGQDSPQWNEGKMP